MFINSIDSKHYLIIKLPPVSPTVHLRAEDDQGAAVEREDGPAEEPAALRGSARPAGEPPASSVRFQRRDGASAQTLNPPPPPSCPQVTREERMVVKPLYDRYRLVKQMLTRVCITPVTVREEKEKSSTPASSCWRAASASGPLFEGLGLGRLQSSDRDRSRLSRRCDDAIITEIHPAVCDTQSGDTLTYSQSIYLIIL